MTLKNFRILRKYWKSPGPQMPEIHNQWHYYKSDVSCEVKHSVKISVRKWCLLLVILTFGIYFSYSWL